MSVKRAYEESHLRYIVWALQWNAICVFTWFGYPLSSIIYFLSLNFQNKCITVDEIHISEANFNRKQHMIAGNKSSSFVAFFFLSPHYQDKYASSPPHEKKFSNNTSTKSSWNIDKIIFLSEYLNIWISE